MTKLLMEIGQDLVQEATYCDIVHARNLPEVPKNLESYKQVSGGGRETNLRKEKKNFRWMTFWRLHYGISRDGGFTTHCVECEVFTLSTHALFEKIRMRMQGWALQVAAQLKPVWETLKKKNEPYKLKLLTCQVSVWLWGKGYMCAILENFVIP